MAVVACLRRCRKVKDDERELDDDFVLVVVAVEVVRDELVLPRLLWVLAFFEGAGVENAVL